MISGSSWVSYLQYRQARYILFQRKFEPRTHTILEVLEEGYIKEVPRWFPGARLNYAENLLWRTDDAIAITESNESGHLSSYSYRELREQVRKLASAFNAHGFRPGDRVAGSCLFVSNFCMSCLIGPTSRVVAIVANRTTTVAIALAVASLGGIFTSSATDMGVKVPLFELSLKLLLNRTDGAF